jgi:hypothetical protein
VPLEQFEAGVHALTKLRDEGKYLIFLSRAGSVRFLGEHKAFSDALAASLKREVVGAEDAQKVLQDVRTVLQHSCRFRSPQRAAAFLQDAEYNGVMKRLATPERKEQFRGLLVRKVNLVFDSLFKGALAQRAERLTTAVAPCVEDLDVEVVSERRDEFHDENICAPFLRIRLRYSQPADSSFPFVVFAPPFEPSSLKSFEIECDESDLDLLLRRLLTAKEMLLRATTDKPIDNAKV